MVAWIMGHNFWILVTMLWIVTGHDFDTTPNICLRATISIHIIIAVKRYARDNIFVEIIHVHVYVSKRRSAIELGIATNK